MQIKQKNTKNGNFYNNWSILTFFLQRFLITFLELLDYRSLLQYLYEVPMTNWVIEAKA